MSVRRSLVAAAVAATLALSAAACAPEGEGASPGASAGAVDCAKDKLKMVTDGIFTIGTDKPAYAPWFIDDDPSSGKGYESAVSYAVAEQLGFGQDEVKWIVVPFNSSFAPGEKDFDVDINQISITDERKNAVDFSSGYYDVAQTVITTKDSPIAGATSIAELKDAKLGAQVGTTSYQVVLDQIKPADDPAVFDTNDLAVQALKNGQVDGIVVDLPTAFYMTSAQLDDGKIIGQLPATKNPDQFGFVLDKGNVLTGCVTQAVDTLRKDGTLEKIETEWLANDEGAPVLT